MEILRSIGLYSGEKGLLFAVMGGQAINAHGFSRQTGDIDLVVRRNDKPAWLELMKKLDYKSGQCDERFARFRSDYLAAWPIDLMFVDDETFSKLYAQSSEVQFGLSRAQVVSPRHLATLKIHALKHFQEHRYARDFADLVMLLRSGRTGLTHEDLKELCLKYADNALFEKVQGELPK